MQEKRWALITGCGAPTGVGSCLALALVDKGYRVFATARRMEQLAHLEGKCELLVLDVTSEESIHVAVAAVKETAGELSVLVNNAGLDGWAPCIDIDVDKFRTLLETNVVGPLTLTQACAPLLVEAGRVRPSVILNIGSFACYGAAWKGAYSATKAAQQVISDVMRVEMANLGVKVITCETGGIDTPMFAKQPKITKTPTSGYYPNFEALAERVDKMKRGAISPEQAGRQLAAYVDSRNPPGKIWVGGTGYIFAWVMPLLTASWRDWFWKMAFFVGEVPAPKRTE